MYASAAELAVAVPERTLVRLSNDDPEATEVDASVVAAELSHSSQLMDLYLGQLYVLPLVAATTLATDVLRTLCVDIARYRLYQRRPETDIPPAVVEAYTRALANLTLIRDGKLGIGAVSLTSGAGYVATRTRDRTFDFDLYP